MQASSWGPGSESRPPRTRSWTEEPAAGEGRSVTGPVQASGRVSGLGRPRARRSARGSVSDVGVGGRRGASDPAWDRRWATASGPAPTGQVTRTGRRRLRDPAWRSSPARRRGDWSDQSPEDGSEGRRRRASTHGRPYLRPLGMARARLIVLEPGIAITAIAAPSRLVRTSRRRTAPNVVDVARVRMAVPTLDHPVWLAPTYSGSRCSTTLKRCRTTRVSSSMVKSGAIERRSSSM